MKTRELKGSGCNYFEISPSLARLLLGSLFVFLTLTRVSCVCEVFGARAGLGCECIMYWADIVAVLRVTWGTEARSPFFNSSLVFPCVFVLFLWVIDSQNQLQVTKYQVPTPGVPPSVWLVCVKKQKNKKQLVLVCWSIRARASLVYKYKYRVSGSGR